MWPVDVLSSGYHEIQQDKAPLIGTSYHWIQRWAMCWPARCNVTSWRSVVWLSRDTTRQSTTNRYELSLDTTLTWAMCQPAMWPAGGSGCCSYYAAAGRLGWRTLGKVAVSWLKILAAKPNPNPTIFSHETATLPNIVHKTYIHRYIETELLRISCLLAQRQHWHRYFAFHSTSPV